MNWKAYYKNIFKQLYLLEPLRAHPAARHVCSELEPLPCRVIRHKEEIPAPHRNQHTLFLNAPAAPLLSRCPGSKGHLCCNYLTIDLYMGCLLGCTYCIMKSYLNFEPIIVNPKTEQTIQRIINLATANPRLTLRVGTGEVGDSLLFDPLFRLSAPFIQAFAPYPNIYFEMKTKTAFVDHLLTIEKKGNAVIGFSLNPQRIIDTEEGSAADLEQRIAAARRAVAAGYQVAFHFDPIFHYQGWEKDYARVITGLRDIPAGKIPWLSLGTFRFLPELAAKIEQRWYLYDEFVLCRDKKYRYLQQLRTEMYRKMQVLLQSHLPGVPVYLCMESSTVWERVFQKKPGQIHKLCAIFKRVETLG